MSSVVGQPPPLISPGLNDPTAAALMMSATDSSPSPIDRNRGYLEDADVAAAGLLLPESTQQPVLNTIGKSSSSSSLPTKPLPPRATEKPRRSRKSKRSSSLRNISEMLADNQSPRSIDMKREKPVETGLPTTEGRTNTQPEQLQQQQQQRHAESQANAGRHHNNHHHHRRSASEELLFANHGYHHYHTRLIAPVQLQQQQLHQHMQLQQQQQQRHHGQNEPENRFHRRSASAELPTHGELQFYNPPMSRPMMFGQPQYDLNPYQVIAPSSSMGTPSSSELSLHHHRVRSWNGHPDAYPPMHGLPVQPPPNTAAAFPHVRHPSAPFLEDSAEMSGIPNPAIHASTSNSRRKKRNGSGRKRSASSNAALPSMYGSFFQPPPPGGTMSMASGDTRRQEFSARSEIISLTKGFRTGGTPPMSPATNTYKKRAPTIRRATIDNTRSSDDPRVTFSPTRTIVYGMGDETTPLTPDLSITTEESAFRKNKNNKRAQSIRSAQYYMREVKGVEQELACRNVLFLLLFLLHLVGMAYLGSLYGTELIKIHGGILDDNKEVIINFQRVIIVASMSGAFAVAVSSLALVLMTIIARRFVQVALFLLIALSFAWGTIGIGLSPRNLVPITGFIALALSVGYTFVVWERIPFHAANLVTALSAVRSNWGAVLVAFFCQSLALAWAIYYVYVVGGVYGAIQNGRLQLSPRMETFVYIMMGVSAYWTFNVLLNIVQVTVAGVVGKWWYVRDGTRSTCCENVGRPFFQAMFYSLGSICFGSLMVGPVRLLRQVTAIFRPNSDSSSLMCLQECLHCIQSCMATCVDHIADHFNPWAFTYVGLYGYGFLDAGHNATELFHRRDWTMIISDDMLPNILLMMSLVIGGITGCFAYLLETVDHYRFATSRDHVVLTFSLGSVVGIVLTSVLFGIISSSVNAVIVCFAASPVDFERNHPELSSEMRSAWREVWPGCMDMMNPRLKLAVAPIDEEEDDFA